MNDNYIYINNNIKKIKKIINNDNFINYTCKNHKPIINIDNDNNKIIKLSILIKNIEYFPHEILEPFNIVDFTLDIIQKNTDNRISFTLQKFNINNDFLNNIFKNFNYKFIIFIDKNKDDEEKSILTIKNKYINLDNNDFIIGIIKNYIENILKNILVNKLEKNLNFLLNSN